jgi:uncharacterized membrane protein YuzA (DUF378 family)
MFFFALAGGAPMLKTVSLVAFVLVIVGAVNWGLVGLAQFDLVAALFGGSSTVPSRIVYGLVGIGGLLLVALQAAPRTAAAPARTFPAMH